MLIRTLSAVVMAALLAACNNSPAPAPNPSPTPQPLVLDSFAAAPNPAPQNVGTVFNWTVLGGSGAVSCQLDVDNDGDFDYSLESCNSASKQSHQYESAGTYTAKLVVSDAGGAKQEKTAGVTVLANNRKPQVLSFSGERGSSELGVRFSFRLFDPEGDILSCKVDLESDGVYEYEFVPCNNTGGNAQVSRVDGQSYSGSFEGKYGSKGPYTARLEVMDAYNQTLEVLPLDVPFAKPVEPGPCEVANLENMGEGSLRERVESGRCSVVTFMEGLSGVIPVSPSIKLVRSVQIVGPGAGVITLDGRKRNPIFYEASEGNYSLSGLTLRNGYNDESGGAIQTNDFSSNLTLESVVIRDSWSSRGGAALSMIASGRLVVRNSQFINNYANGKRSRGGAIEVLYSNNVLFENNRFVGNYSEGRGGALYLDVLFDPATLRGNTFSNNQANSDGGAIYIGSGVEDVTLQGNTFSNNQANSYGGAIYTAPYINTLSFSNNSFVGNQAEAGGAVFINDQDDPLTVNFSNNTFSNNQAQNNGGAILARQNIDALIFSNNTFSNNQAGYAGGAIFAEGDIGTLSFSGDVFSGNSADYGGGLYLDFDAGESVTFTNVRFEDNVAAQDGGAIFPSYGTVTLDLASRILNNTATNQGGGIFMMGGTLELPSVVPSGSPIIAGNTCNGTAPCGGGVYNNGGLGIINGDIANGISGNVGSDVAP